MRFTKKNRQRVLDQNEGFRTDTSYTGKNFSESRKYEVKGGELHIRSTSKSSWAGSRRTDDYRYDANAEETKRFLRSNSDELNTDGLE